MKRLQKISSDELHNIFRDVPIVYPKQLPELVTSEAVALCDFQYIFWVLNKLDYSFNIGMQVQLQGKVNKEYVAQAFEYVVKYNSAFWLNFNKEIPTQITRREGKFQLISHDVSLSSESRRMLDIEFHKNMMSFIPLTQQPLIRVFLYKVNNDLHELHLVIPHIIVDNASCEIVFAEFKAAYEKLTLGKKLESLAIQDSYLNYVKLNNNHYGKNLKAKIDFWKSYNKGFSMLDFGKKYHLPDAAKQSKNLFHYPLASQAVKKFMDWHQEKNINVSTGLIAACQIVFYKLAQQNKVPIILIHSGRAGSHYKYTVGLFSEYKRINVTLNKEDRFIDCINTIEEELIKTATYRKLLSFY